MSEKRKISLRKKFYFAGGLFIFFCIFCEALILILGWAPPLKVHSYFVAASDGLPYVLKKNHLFSGRNLTDEFELHAQTNSLGFIDEEWPIKKKEGEIRIVTLGDSFTSSNGRKDAIRYVNETEIILKNTFDQNVNILNMGMPGYFPAAEAILLEKRALIYDPDIVVVNFSDNDIVDSSRGLSAVAIAQNNLMRKKHADALGPILSRLYIHSYFFRWYLKMTILDKLPFNMGDDFTEVYKENGKYEENWLEIFEHFRKMKKLCEDKNIQFVIVHIPLPGALDKIYAENRLKEFCLKENCLFIKTREELKKLTGKERIYFEKDEHFKDKGNKAIADNVSSILSTLIKK
jgi:lysophospholipase L1-like esterase